MPNYDLMPKFNAGEPRFRAYSPEEIHRLRDVVRCGRCQYEVPMDQYRSIKECPACGLTAADLVEA